MLKEILARHQYQVLLLFILLLVILALAPTYSNGTPYSMPLSILIAPLIILFAPIYLVYAISSYLIEKRARNVHLSEDVVGKRVYFVWLFLINAAHLFLVYSADSSYSIFDIEDFGFFVIYNVVSIGLGYVAYNKGYLKAGSQITFSLMFLIVLFFVFQIFKGAYINGYF